MSSLTSKFKIVQCPTAFLYLYTVFVTTDFRERDVFNNERHLQFSYTDSSN